MAKTAVSNQPNTKSLVEKNLTSTKKGYDYKNLPVLKYLRKNRILYFSQVNWNCFLVAQLILKLMLSYCSVADIISNDWAEMTETGSVTVKREGVPNSVNKLANRKWYCIASSGPKSWLTEVEWWQRASRPAAVCPPPSPHCSLSAP